MNDEATNLVVPAGERALVRDEKRRQYWRVVGPLVP
jgi:hypothetical protein